MVATFHHLLVAHLLMFRLPRDQAFYTSVSMFPMLAIWVAGHEGTHWLAGHMFGLSGKFVVFGRRGVSKLWFPSVFAVSFDDEAYYALTRAKRRVIAGAGPFWDMAVAALCLSLYHSVSLTFALPWVMAICQVFGILLFCTSLLGNIIPHAGRNDGWLVLWPDDRVAVRQSARRVAVDTE
jgi:hypothetical protein